MTLSLDKSTWKRVALGDVAAASKEKVDPESGDVERYIAGEHMDTDDLEIRRWGDVGGGYLGPAFHRRFRPGQILYGSRRTYLRKVAVAEFGGVVANTTFVVETKDPGSLLQEFLPFVMTSEPFHAFAIQESKGSVNPYVNWSDIARYGFDLPPLDEQKRLADLLWAVELHRRAIPLRALIAVQAWMLESLVGMKVGRSVRIDDLGSVLMGRQRSPKHADGEHMVPYLRVANVGDDKLRLSDVKQMNFTPEEQERYSVLPNDILISEGQSRELVGQSALVTSLAEPMCFQNTLIRFRPDADVIRPAYAQALFRACLHSGVFAEIATQTTSIAHLGVKRFAQLEVQVPEISAQDHFLSQFTMVGAAIDSATAEAESLSNLRQSLFRAVFGGDA